MVWRLDAGLLHMPGNFHNDILTKIDIIAHNSCKTTHNLEPVILPKFENHFHETSSLAHAIDLVPKILSTKHTIGNFAWGLLLHVPVGITTI